MHDIGRWKLHVQRWLHLPAIGINIIDDYPGMKTNHQSTSSCILTGHPLSFILSFFSAVRGRSTSKEKRMIPAPWENPGSSPQWPSFSTSVWMNWRSLSATGSSLPEERSWRKVTQQKRLTMGEMHLPRYQWMYCVKIFNHETVTSFSCDMLPHKKCTLFYCARGDL